MKVKDLAENLGLDVEEYYEIFDLYIQTTSSDLEQLKSALDSGDSEKAHEKAHSIKGASGNLGLTELFEAAKAIDDRARINSLDGLEEMVQGFCVKYEKVVEALGRGHLSN